MNAASSALVAALQTLVDNEMLKPEISTAGIQVKNAIKLLAFANRDLNDRRKDAIRNSINPLYMSLLNHDRSPSFEWLLGDDIDTDMDELDKQKKQGERLVKPRSQNPQPYRRRGGYQNTETRDSNQRDSRSSSDHRDTQRSNDLVRYSRSSSQSNQDFYRHSYPQNYQRYYSRNSRRSSR